MLVFASTSSVMVFFQMFLSQVAITKKAQHKLSQASWPVKEAGGAEECAFPKSLGHVLYKG